MYTLGAVEPLTTLYRPVGQAEYDLVVEHGKFPPRLEWQPIFYPVLTEEYAVKIASEWNTKDSFSGNVGYVLRFHVKTSFLDAFSVQTVGGSAHQEYWIPAERLEEFNAAIVGQIEMIGEYR